MNKFVMGTAAVVLGFVLSACGASAGEIYDKDYVPASSHDVWQDDSILICDGKGVCRQQPMGGHWVTVYDPECYEVKFRNDEGKKGKDCVSESEYDSLDIGDWYEK